MNTDDKKNYRSRLYRIFEDNFPLRSFFVNTRLNLSSAQFALEMHRVYYFTASETFISDLHILRIYNMIPIAIKDCHIQTALNII